MKMIVLSDTFTEALAKVLPATNQEASVQLFVLKGTVTLTAQNQLMTICADTVCESSDEFMVKIPGKQILEYLSDVPSAKVTLEFELPSKMTIRHGRNKATFQLVQDPQIIEVRRVEAGVSVSINAIKLATFVEKIKGFCVAEDTRYYATGAYLWIDKLCMHAVASDSQRLAKIEIPISVERQADDAVIVPRRALDEVARVCSNLSGDVTISWHKESETFQLQAETYFMTARCISGAYPPWQAACPSNINLSVELAKCELIDSLRLAARCADKTNGIIKLSFKGEELEISSFSAGSKEGTHIIDAYSGSVPFECSYPSALLIDALNSVDSDKVSIEWDNVNRPARIRCEDESFFYLIVPTRY